LLLEIINEVTDQAHEAVSFGRIAAPFQLAVQVIQHPAKIFEF